MKAVLIRKFGPPEVMQIEEVDKPLISDDEILIRVFCSSVNPVDWKIRNGSLKFLVGSRFPMALGFDVAGEVVDSGPLVMAFKKGDRVFAMLDYRQRGAYAEYARVRAASAAPMPENLGFREAAAIPLAGLTAYQALHYKGRIKGRGEEVLINGASGGVGSFAVQIAKAAGVIVTAVCGTTNIEGVKALGADRVIDYKQEDFTMSPARYDIIFDAVGALSFFRIRRNLTDSGRYVSTLPNVGNICSLSLVPLLSVFGYKKKSSLVNVRPNGHDLGILATLAKEKKLVPLIDRTFKLEEIGEAHAYSESGHVRGKIVIEIS